eukprot:jgi/Psemu1/65333/estExt_Genemark1.C_1210021
MNGCNADKSCVGGGSSVQDRKKFFENHINEQKRRENALVPSSMSSCTSPTAFSTVVGSRAQMFVEDRTDSESLFHNISDRTEPDPSFGTFGTFITKSGSDSESEIDPSDLLEQEFMYYASKENGEDPAMNIWQGDECVSHNLNEENAVRESDSYIEKSRSLDDKLLPFLDEDNEVEPGFSPSSGRMDSTEAFESMNQIEKFDNWPASHKMVDRSEENHEKREQGNGGHSEALENFQKSQKSDGETLETKSLSDRTKVKILVTRKVAESACSATNTSTMNIDGTEIVNQYPSTENMNIDDMITEFQQASSQLFDEFYDDSSPDNSLSDKDLDSRSNQVNDRVNFFSNNDEICEEESVDDISSCDSIIVLDALTTRDLEELTDKHERPLSKDVFISNDYICPSESTDYSIDSKGNSKGTKSISSRSKLSLKNRKRKGKGVGKMLIKATMGMGKSVKKSVSQITQITSVVKNSMKAKTAKEPSTSKVDDNSDKESRRQDVEFFDEKLAIELVKDDKGISMASQYLVAGETILNEAAQLKKNNDLDGSEELIRKAHTYAYVGRQLAKQYLYEQNEDMHDGPVMASSDLASAVNDDGISAFEDFFFSFLQCVGPCDGDESLLMSIQVDETLDILRKVSMEETKALNGAMAKNNEGGNEDYGREKVRAAIRHDQQKTANSDGKRDRETSQSRNLALRRFLYDLQSFYNEDNYLNLAPAVFMERDSSEKNRRINDVINDIQPRRTNQGAAEGESDSQDDSSQNTNKSMKSQYSESLKFDDGRDSLHTRSYSTAGSIGKEQSSTKSQRDRRPKEESLTEGIRVGTTVLSTAVKQKELKKKKTRKWFSAVGRKHRG